MKLLVFFTLAVAILFSDYSYGQQHNEAGQIQVAEIATSGSYPWWLAHDALESLRGYTLKSDKVKMVVIEALNYKAPLMPSRVPAYTESDYRLQEMKVRDAAASLLSLPTNNRHSSQIIQALSQILDSGPPDNRLRIQRILDSATGPAICALNLIMSMPPVP